MCFSATASLSAGAFLLGLGTLTLKSAGGPRERAFAAIPLLFAVQQLLEGVIWLTFSYEAPLLRAVMTHAYAFFSHVLWPIYVPVAVLLIEPPGRRRQALLVFVAAGLASHGRGSDRTFIQRSVHDENVRQQRILVLDGCHLPVLNFVAYNTPSSATVTKNVTDLRG